MPSTAKSLGINPHNFRSAAFGAARYLAQYKSRGTKGMLAAYNAGPAGNPNNPETRAYIKRVLGYAKKSAGSEVDTETYVPGKATYTPGKSRASERRKAILSYFQAKEGAKPSAAMQAVGIDPTQFYGKGPAALAKTLGKLSDEPGTVEVTPGKFEGKMGSAKGDVVAIGKLAQKMGLHVSENSAFGGVTAVHVPNSWHYQDRAIDVGGDAKTLRRFARKVVRRWGKRAKEVIYTPLRYSIKNGKKVSPYARKKHRNHVHVAI